MTWGWDVGKPSILGKLGGVDQILREVFKYKKLGIYNMHFDFVGTHIL